MTFIIKPHQPLLLLQSSSAQSGLPVLRQIITQRLQKDDKTLLFCFIHPPSYLLDTTVDNVACFDHSAHVPGYNSNMHDCSNDLISTVQTAPAGPLTVVIDSVDALLLDSGSTATTYKLLHQLITLIRARPNFSRLILQTVSPSKLIPLLSQPAFSPSLTHLIVHPPVLLSHLATAYLTPPPPASTPAKFWGVFLPLSERGYETDRLVFGSGGEGSGGRDEIVVEVLIRGGGDGSGRRRTVERSLEGWSTARDGFCDLVGLESLRSIWTNKQVDQETPDPTQNVSFNLNLTPSQQQSRAQVPLPYAHEGQHSDKQASKAPQAAIFYDPDSADDIDDDDPDEDLDI